MVDPFLPKKSFEMHLILTVFAESARQKSAVLQDFAGIARDGCAERQPRERRHQLIDRRTTFNVQLEITVTVESTK